MTNKKERVICQQLWAKNKYMVLSKSSKIYLEVRQYLKQEDVNVEKVQEYIDKANKLEEDKGQMTNALHHVWGYFKKYATVEEKDNFFTLLDEYCEGSIDKERLLDEVRELLKKYPNNYLEQSTFITGEM